jgi:hypothetical protein
VFVVRGGTRPYPPIVDVVNDGGHRDAVDGFALVAGDDTLTGVEEAMAPGTSYWVTAPFGALFRVDVRHDVLVSLDARTGGDDECARYGRLLADRIATLTGGSAARA